TGAFQFTNVPTGTYSLGGGPVNGLLGGTGNSVIASITVGSGQAVVSNLAFPGAGLAPQFISMKLFLTSTTPADFPFGGAPGAPTTPVDNAPFVSSAIGPVALSQTNPSKTID